MKTLSIKGVPPTLQERLKRRAEQNRRSLKVTGEAALVWGQVQGEARRRGWPQSVLDSLIAATARAHGLAVVTRNVADMRELGVEVVSPWERGPG